MTSPASDDYAKRLITAGQAVGTTNPALANTLANSGLNSAQIQQIGGFTQGLNLASTNQLAIDSGVKTDFSAGEQNLLAAVNEPTPNQPKPAPADSRSFLEKAVDTVGGALSDGGNFLLHNPVTGAIMDGLDWIGNVAHMPFRMISGAIGGEDDKTMQSMGYDPHSIGSELAFMWEHGESNYHDLSHARDAYGEDLVDLAVQQQADPEGFQKKLETMDPAAAADLTKKLNSDEFKQAFAAVDSQHISIGRDLANVVLAPFGSSPKAMENGAYSTVFHMISGVADAAYTWMADPTLVLGKVSAGLRAADALGRVAEDASLSTKLVTKLSQAGGAKRASGIEHVVDQAGIEKLLQVKDGKAITAVGQGWQKFLDQAAAFREQTRIINSGDLSAEERAAAEATRAKILVQVQTTHKDLMPLWDEINGSRVLAPKNFAFRTGTPSATSEHAAEEAAAGEEATAGEQVAAESANKAPTTWDDIKALGAHMSGPKAPPTVGKLREELDFLKGRAKTLQDKDGHVPDSLKDYIAQHEHRIEEVGAGRPDPGSPGARAAAATPTPARGAGGNGMHLVNGFAPYSPEAEALKAAKAAATPKGAEVVAPKAEAVAPKAEVVAPKAEARPPLGGPVDPLDEAQYEKTLTSRVAGGWEATNGAPIEDLEDLGQYLVSTGGLLRLTNGAPAREAMVMPGKVSWWAERMAAGKAASRGRWLDYTGNDLRAIPTDAEHDALSTLDSAGADEAKRLEIGEVQHNLLRSGTKDGEGFNPLKRARARFERVNRRLTTLLPNVKELDLTDSSSVNTIEQFARFYLNKGDATKLAATYAAGDLAARRAVAHGMLQQVFHASGLSKSPQGREMMNKYILDGAERDKQMYGLEGTDVIQRDGKEVHAALYNSQLSHTVPLPALKEMNQLAIKFAVGSWASKTGLTGLGGAVQSNRMDALMGHIKMGWITSAAGGLRNALDEVVGFAAKGMGREVLKSRVAYTKATEVARAERVKASQDYQALVKQYGTHAGADEHIAELQGKHMLSLDQAKAEHARSLRALNDETYAPVKPVLPLDEAQEGIEKAEKALEDARALENAIHYRIPLAFRRVGDTINDKLVGSALGKVLSHMGPRWEVTPERINYAHELQNEELRAILRDGVQQTHFADNYGAIAGEQGAMGLHRAGLQAREYSYKQIGWGQVEPDGGHGLDDWAKYMQQRFADPHEASHAWVQAYYHTGGDVDAAKASVRAYLEDPRMKHFLSNAEVTQQLKSGAKVTDATRDQMKDELADRISADLLHGLARRADTDAGKAGGINDDLLYHLAHADQHGVPDRSWLANNIPTEERPQHTVGRLFAPYNQAHAPGTLAQGYGQMMTHAYGKMVTDQVDALSRNPLMASLYMNAREHIQPWEKHLVDQGWDEESAREVCARMSLAHAEQEAYKHIDNPHVSSQFSLISRNFANFERAQEDWLRRWGRTFKDNPEIIRKAQLTLHAGTATGMVEQDDQGNLMFHYPGSELAFRTFNKAMSAMGLGGVVQIPVTGELTSQLQFLSPSLTQPFGLTGSPLISLPLKAISATVGAHHPILMAALDKAVNGQMGSGRDWYEQLMPPTMNRIIKGVLSTDPASTYGAAYANATFALAASGYWDKLDGNDPTAIANAQQSLTAQVHNNMFLNTLFGFFAPAAPQMSQDASGITKQSGHGTNADWSAHVAGYNSLNDEARKALADLGPTRFRTWWAAVHPQEMIYDQSGAGVRTQVGTSSAFAPATIAAAEWMQNNRSFLSTYGGKGGVGTYFIPQGQQGTVDGSYSDVAYRAQLENGIRQYKDLSSLLPGVIVQRGESQYYAAKDQFDAQIAAAKNSGDMYTAKQLEQEWSDKKKEIYAGNPLLAQKNASYATNGSEQQVAVGDLQRMLNDPSAQPAIGPYREAVATLLDAYSQYTEANTALSGRQGSEATRMRTELKDNYATTTAAVTAQYPDLTDLVRGVFRLPN